MLLSWVCSDFEVLVVRLQLSSREYNRFAAALVMSSVFPGFYDTTCYGFGRFHTFAFCAV